MVRGLHDVLACEDLEVSKIEALEAKLASPEMQGMDDAAYWPRQAVFNELLDVLHARNRRQIDANWKAIEELVGYPPPR